MKTPLTALCALALLLILACFVVILRGDFETGRNLGVLGLLAALPVTLGALRRHAR